jgi:hypothetical protein
MAPPDAPSNVSAVAGDTEATVTWTAPASEGSSPITGYAVTTHPGDEATYVDAARTALVQHLVNGRSYTFTVRAISAAGSSISSSPSEAIRPRVLVDPAQSTVKTWPEGSVPADGQSPLVVTFRLKNHRGELVAGEPVSCQVSGEGATVSPDEGLSEEDGTFACTVRSRISGEHTVTATAGVDTVVELTEVVTFGAECPTGYIGLKCRACDEGYQDNNHDETCEPSCATAAVSCQGNSLCSDASGTAACVCAPGYVGLPVCPINVDDCTPSSCSAHQYCVDGVNSFTCECQAGYTGPTCEDCTEGYQDNDHDGTCLPTCATSGLVCQNGGTCTDASGQAACDCSGAPTSPAAAYFLYSSGFTNGAALGGRTGVDARAISTLPATLPSAGTATYGAYGFMSEAGNALVDFPATHCLPSNIPVYGVRSDGTQTLLANDWADFMDGTISTTIGNALGLVDYNFFWTGSTNTGAAAGHDCSGWTSSVGNDGFASNRMNSTTDWLDVGVPLNCGSGYYQLSLAFCTANCP